MSGEKNEKIFQLRPLDSAAAENKAKSKKGLQTNWGETISYSAIEERYGPRAAYDLLLAMERLAQKKADGVLDPDERFENILTLLNEKASRCIH
jgi:hypothetical protein